MASFSFTQLGGNGRRRGHLKSEFEVVGVGTATGTYGTAKVPVVASDFGLATLTDLRVETTGTGTFGYAARWDPSGPYIRLFGQTAASSALVEVGTATDVGTHLFNITAEGR